MEPLLYAELYDEYYIKEGDIVYKLIPEIDHGIPVYKGEKIEEPINPNLVFSKECPDKLRTYEDIGAGNICLTDTTSIPVYFSERPRGDSPKKNNKKRSSKKQPSSSKTEEKKPKVVENDEKKTPNDLQEYLFGIEPIKTLTRSEGPGKNPYEYTENTKKEEDEEEKKLIEFLDMENIAN